MTSREDTVVALERLSLDVTRCRACPRLVAWREHVAAERTARFADQVYWGRPVPGLGDPGARILIVGLAPAAHGANRTGRMFTGDRSGDFLFASMYRTGLANQPTSVAADDGLRLLDAWVTAVNRCAPPDNKPTPEERDRCRPFLGRELTLLGQARVIVSLGGWSWDGVLRALAQRGAVVRPKPVFGHGVEARVGAWTLIGCYHPSQQNTFTGRLTPAMLDAVFARARVLAGLDGPDESTGPPEARESRGQP